MMCFFAAVLRWLLLAARAPQVKLFLPCVAMLLLVLACCGIWLGESRPSLCFRTFFPFPRSPPLSRPSLRSSYPLWSGEWAVLDDGASVLLFPCYSPLFVPSSPRGPGASGALVHCRSSDGHEDRRARPAACGCVNWKQKGLVSAPSNERGQARRRDGAAFSVPDGQGACGSYAVCTMQRSTRAVLQLDYWLMRVLRHRRLQCGRRVHRIGAVLLLRPFVCRQLPRRRRLSMRSHSVHLL